MSLFKLLTFIKPYCFHNSSIRSFDNIKFLRLNIRPNNFQLKNFATVLCMKMAPKTALFIVAEGSEELELVAPVDILRRANVIIFLYAYNLYNLKLIIFRL